MKKLTFEQFVTKAKNVHGDRYMYPEQTYGGRRAYVEIICKIHGSFIQTGGSHIDGRSGCPKCGLIHNVKQRTMTLEQFINKSKDVYGDLDRYEKVNYVGTMKSVTITCNLHGDYLVRPHNYLMMGQRCTKCTKEGVVNPNPKKKHYNNREKTRRKTDPMFVMIKRLRKRLREAVVNKHEVRDKKLKEVLGCSYEELLIHLENKFLDGMSWENMNLWHIDHIMPLASAKNLEDIYKLNHYTNLQPLWAKDNLQKNARLPNDFCV